MKQIIYLGGKKARNYTAPHEETDVIGDCDWKEGDVKTELVDYEIEWNDAEREYYPNGDYTGVTTSTIKGIVPIPKKQEGEEELDEFKLLCMIQNEFREIEKLSFSEAHKRKLEMLTYFTIARKS